MSAWWLFFSLGATVTVSLLSLFSCCYAKWRNITLLLYDIGVASRSSSARKSAMTENQVVSQLIKP